MFLQWNVWAVVVIDRTGLPLASESKLPDCKRRALRLQQPAPELMPRQADSKGEQIVSAKTFFRRGEDVHARSETFPD